MEYIKKGNAIFFCSDISFGNTSGAYLDKEKPTTESELEIWKKEAREKASQNRSAFFNSVLQIPPQNAFMHDLNEDKENTIILSLTKDFVNSNPDLYNTDIEADIVITDLLDIPLIFNYADCIPLIFYDSELDIVAHIHLSREHIEKELHLKAYRYLLQLGLIPEHIICYIGPHISKESYLYTHGDDLIKDEKWRKHITISSLEGENYSNPCNIDMAGRIVEDLLDIGLSSDNLMVSRIDTRVHPDYYSNYNYRHKQTPHDLRFVCGVVLSSKLVNSLDDYGSLARDVGLYRKDSILDDGNPIKILK